MVRDQKTAMYLLCYHSEKPASFVGSEGQFLVVDRAINDGLWPYDNGDDPSFFVARKGGPLTWGVCRQDVRNSIRNGSIVAFFSFTPMQKGKVLYRLCAVTTVLSKHDVRAVHQDRQFSEFRKLYINAMIRPTKDGWLYDESDRAKHKRHKDWLWRIADHHGLTTVEKFEEKHEAIYRNGFIPNDILEKGHLELAENYIVFSTTGKDSYICVNPPEVAIASKGSHEVWSDKRLKSLTVETAAKYHNGGRDYLRAANSSGRNVHRHIRFEMPSDEAETWRRQLIEALKVADKKEKTGHLTNRLAGYGKCS